mmetsp:Transcript_38736/g.124300  ORF Transcript_38736/g.124300 Transcript_38736/m.124300 type:complete len:543 (-) Transcript_38736:12-1640(-)
MPVQRRHLRSDALEHLVEHHDQRRIVAAHLDEADGQPGHVDGAVVGQQDGVGGQRAGARRVVRIQQIRHAQVDLGRVAERAVPLAVVLNVFGAAAHAADSLVFDAKPRDAETRRSRGALRRGLPRSCKRARREETARTVAAAVRHDGQRDAHRLAVLDAGVVPRVFHRRHRATPRRQLVQTDAHRRRRVHIVEHVVRRRRVLARRKQLDDHPIHIGRLLANEQHALREKDDPADHLQTLVREGRVAGWRRAQPLASPALEHVRGSPLHVPRSHEALQRCWDGHKRHGRFEAGQVFLHARRVGHEEHALSTVHRREPHSPTPKRRGGQPFEESGVAAQSVDLVTVTNVLAHAARSLVGRNSGEDGKMVRRVNEDWLWPHDPRHECRHDQQLRPEAGHVCNASEGLQEVPLIGMDRFDAAPRRASLLRAARYGLEVALEASAAFSECAVGRVFVQLCGWTDDSTSVQSSLQQADRRRMQLRGETRMVRCTSAHTVARCRRLLRLRDGGPPRGDAGLEGFGDCLCGPEIRHHHVRYRRADTAQGS